MTQPMNKYQLSIISLLLVYSAILGSVTVFRSTNDMPDTLEGRYQAVFLSDGQVYFGKLSNHNASFTELRNVYYLKYGKELQQGGADVQSQNLNLVKLGGEVHGPEDMMYIAKDKILFIENLKEGSSVVQAIKRNGSQ
jgi:hypothetical protein